MAEHFVLGMPIRVSDEIRQPLGAVVVIKALGADGDLCHWISKTEDVSRVEAVGMLCVAADEFRAALLSLPRDEGLPWLTGSRILGVSSRTCSAGSTR